MTSEREQEFKRLVANYESLGDRRDWDGTSAAIIALERFGAKQNEYGDWVDTKAEPPSVVIYVLDGGLNNDRDRVWRFGGYTLTREAGEAACEAHALEWGYGAITWARHDDDKSVGYVTTLGYGYSVTRVVVSNEVQP